MAVRWSQSAEKHLLIEDALDLDARQATPAEEAALDSVLAEEVSDGSNEIASEAGHLASRDLARSVNQVGLDEELATIEDMEELGRLAGRYSLGRSSRQGPSPVRQVRLPAELDEALTRRTEIEHRTRSEIIRAALESYLKRAS